MLLFQQVAALREEESRDDCWFILPEENDEDVNWMAFSVEIEGPVGIFLSYIHLLRSRKTTL